MTILKPGDVCPICGRKIRTEDPDALELLSCYARVFELLNKGVRPADCQEEDSKGGRKDDP